MTDLELLKWAYETLDNLKVPIIYFEEISLPVANVSKRLKILYQVVIETIEKNKAEQETSKEEPVEEPVEESTLEN